MNKMPPNPNAIIAALIDIASAAYVLNHGAIPVAEGDESVSASHLATLNEKLAVLESLPQLADNENFSGPRRAAGWLASFLVGEVALHIEPGKLKELQTALAQARKMPLVASEFETDMRAYQDADLLSKLRMMCGYVENGSEQSVSIYQDDATREWTLRVGTDNTILKSKARRYHSTSFHQVIRLAAQDEIPEEEPEPEECKFCGVESTTPCDAPPSGPCELANNAVHGSDPTKPRSQAPAGPSPMQLKRDEMQLALIDVKEFVGVEEAKRIIVSVGHSPRKMADIPDNRVQAVLDAALERLAKERRSRQDQSARGVVELPVERLSFPMPPPYVKPEGYVPGEETFPLSPTTEQQLHDAGAALGNPSPVVEPTEKPDDQVQGQGGEFDGGGASGDWTQ